MNLDHALLHSLIPHAKDIDIVTYLSPLNSCMVEFEINTPLRIAAFLAQLAHETLSLYYKEEIASGDAYNERIDLGNTDPLAISAAKNSLSTVGRFYKGRGLLQTTGYYNYKVVGEALGLDLVKYPSLLLKPSNACRAAGWFWQYHNCNELADKGNFGAITKKINGGTNGAKERLVNYSICKKVLEC